MEHSMVEKNKQKRCKKCNALLKDQLGYCNNCMRSSNLRGLVKFDTKINKEKLK